MRATRFFIDMCIVFFVSMVYAVNSHAMEQLVDARDHYGRTPLYHALFHPYKYPDFQQAEKLLAQGADVNQRQEWSCMKGTLLHTAAERRGCGVEAIVKFLLQHGADKHAQDAFGKTPFDYAIEQQNGYKNLIDLLR